MTKPLDLYRAKYAGRLQLLYGAAPLTDAQVLVAIARDIDSGVLTLSELREAFGEAPMSLDELLDDAAKDVGNPRHRALVIFSSRSDMNEASTRQMPKYVALGGKWRSSDKRWLFESGATIDFGVIEKDGDEHKLMGMAWNWLGIHIIESLSKEQFGALMSRVRPAEGTKRIIRW